MIADAETLREQIDYYRARAGEYDEWFFRQGRYDRGDELNRRWHAEVARVQAALRNFHPAGDILELACGTGLWTELLAPYARNLTAVDASPEMIALNRIRTGNPGVQYVCADLFAWAPPAAQFDTVFFAFWLSHVPPSRFDDFWENVRRSLRPGGRVFFIDSRFDPMSSAADHEPPDMAAGTHVRRLKDGREFRIWKFFHDPSHLEQQLAALGWKVKVEPTPHYFFWGSGTYGRPS